ncbi:hypothetical protein IMZ48_48400 [Candidatus Bathyarchaeota archaeon]|nr:hypothetical protein [Candidatus Bathyarchaeota archaeon]
MVVPSTTIDATAKQHGDPKFLFPLSEKTCPLSFRSLVHRTTSHGGLDASASAWSRRNCELSDALRLWPWLCMKAGDEGREPVEPGLKGDMRDWKRRSKGRREGIGELRPEREAIEGRTLLPGDEKEDP